MNSKFIYQTAHEKREEARIKAYEPSVREMSKMPNLELTSADPAPTGGMLYMAERGKGENTEYIVWNCHHGDTLTNGFYTNDIWDAIEEYAKRQGR